jgi:hypothetical protein
MTVHCEGDCWLMEQLGEKQDFESELSRHGFHHEVFTLHVLRQVASGRQADWNQDYTVTVTNIVNSQTKVYEGGTRKDWVVNFARDLARGLYGGPSTVTQSGPGRRQ